MYTALLKWGHKFLYAKWWLWWQQNWMKLRVWLTVGGGGILIRVKINLAWGCFWKVVAGENLTQMPNLHRKILRFFVAFV